MARQAVRAVVVNQDAFVGRRAAVRGLAWSHHIGNTLFSRHR
jgi:hypothetical protein